MVLQKDIKTIGAGYINTDEDVFLKRGLKFVLEDIIKRSKEREPRHEGEFDLTQIKTLIKRLDNTPLCVPSKKSESIPIAATDTKKRAASFISKRIKEQLSKRD